MQLNVHFFSGRWLFDISPASGLPDLEPPPNGQMMISSGLPGPQERLAPRRSTILGFSSQDSGIGRDDAVLLV